MDSRVNTAETGGYEFRKFFLVPSERLLFRNGKAVSLSPKVFDVLVCLVENNGHLVEKDELLDNIWADTFVEEATLTRTVSRLRKSLGENAESHFIETVPTKGYRFTAEVKYVEADNNPIESGGSENQFKGHLSGVDVADRESAISENKNWFIKSRWAAALGISAVLVVAFVLLWGFDRSVKEASTVKTMAVLPFKMIGETEKDRALKLGMADALIIKFSSLKKIVVRPTSAISKYAGKEFDAPKIGKQLGVDAVLEGNMQRDGERLRVTVQLLRSSDGRTLWAEKFNARENDIFAIQDNISTQVTEALALEMTGAEQKQLTKHFTENKDAYDAYITGRYLWSRRTPKDLRDALGFFGKAIEFDRDYALAYSGLADCYQLFAEYRLMPVDEAFANARNAGKRALELDPTLAEAHASLAYTLAFYDWNFKEGEKEFKRALELNPNYITARIWYSEYLHISGRFDESWEEIKKAQALAPRLPTVDSDILTLHYLQRDFDALLLKAKQLVEREPEFAYGYVFLYYAYEQKGMKKEAIEVFLNGIVNYYGDNPAHIIELRNAFRKRGWKGFWIKRIEQMKQEPDSSKYLAWDYLFCYVRAGDKKRAIEALKQSYKARDRWIVAVKYDPSFDSLRSDPEFREIVQQFENRQKN